MRTKKYIWSCFAAFSLSLCAAGTANVYAESYAEAKVFEDVTAAVTGDDQFGDVLLELTEIDLEYGDSVNLAFSGGFGMEGVPFYPEFFGKKGTTILTDFYEHLAVAGVGYSFNGEARIEAGETLTITLDERGRYREEFEAYNVPSASERRENQSDEAYCNAREITAGSIAPGVLYRGASPFDVSFGRAELMSRYVLDHGIRCILDLADSQEALEEKEGLPDEIREMISSGNVIACHLGIDYTDPATKNAIGEGLAAMSEMEGPYLIQCSLGRDRTGVISAILEALCGASYEEIVGDYMKSYEDLHDINMDPVSLQYQLFKERLDSKLEETLGFPPEALPDADLQAAAREYLQTCGMTQEAIDRLAERLTEGAAEMAGTVQTEAEQAA